MALTNTERQARWRERHIRERRLAQRLVNLLVRQHTDEKHIEEIAIILNQLLNRWGGRTLRRKLVDLTKAKPPEWGKRNLALEVELHATEREAWKHDHPGVEYPEHECGLTDRQYSDLQRWRRQRQKAADKPLGNRLPTALGT
jgi:hypothetical protein